ncbi:3-phosphoserine/phosphohydroxythreonine transaminase [Legionella yabuuchiae]|uniref:3-phosphoserine/phosphohydroxythreonine transaminase n=1 Tax=Legionella yabuuchiae TaxID=376727 RepID=UPI0010556FF8|nr:3-phosphoserine/phosphohydroxythreonine transaminase [Legionella yabuuchiae]
MQNRPYNFSAGPSMLPDAILKEVQAELLNWQGSGRSVMEIGHRTEAIKSLMDETASDLRDLLSIPSKYHILFLPTPARAQFSMIPMNLLANDTVGAYWISGIWSKLAFKEAEKIAKAYCVGSSEVSNFTHTPEFHLNSVPEHTAYLYFTPNETINGVKIPTPFVQMPLIADMTSCLLTEPINVSDYGLIFAGAQKNISIPGLTVVILHPDTLPTHRTKPLPTMLDYQTHIAHKSLYSTPPVFNCYIAGKMFKWIKAQGGVEAMFKMNQLKSIRLYEFIDASDFYACPVTDEARSIVNVCFKLTKSELEDDFLRQAEQHGLHALKGHRTVGGLRASLYNAMPMEGVEALIHFMHRYAKEHS